MRLRLVKSFNYGSSIFRTTVHMFVTVFAGLPRESVDPPAGADRLRNFTLNRKVSPLQRDLGLV
jgi:hypothetical protein